MPANKKYVPSNKVASGKFYKSPEERAAVRAARIAEQEAIQAEKEAAIAAIMAAEEAAAQAIIDDAMAAQVARATRKARIQAEKARIQAEKEEAERAAQRAYMQSPRGLLEIMIKGIVGINLTRDTLIFDENFIGSEFCLFLFGNDTISVPAERPMEIELKEFLGEEAQEKRRLKKVAAADAVIAKEEADRLAEREAIERTEAKALAEQKTIEKKIAAEKKAAEEKIAAEKKAAEEKIAADKKMAAEKKILLKARAEAAAVERVAKKATRREYFKTPRDKLEIEINSIVGIDMVEDNLVFDDEFIGSILYLRGGKEIQVPKERPTEINIAHLV